MNNKSLKRNLFGRFTQNELKITAEIAELYCLGKGHVRNVMFKRARRGKLTINLLGELLKKAYSNGMDFKFTKICEHFMEESLNGTSSENLIKDAARVRLALSSTDNSKNVTKKFGTPTSQKQINVNFENVRTDLEDFFTISGHIYRGKHKLFPFVVISQNDSDIIIRVEDSMTKLLRHNDDELVISQWQGQWANNFFQYTVGQMRKALKMKEK